MKKLLTLLLAVALATTAATTAFADDNNTEIKPGTNGNLNPSTGTTSVTYTVQPTYTVTIPAEVNLSNSNLVLATVEAKDVRIEKNQNLVITVASTGKTETQTNFVAKTTEGAEQEYTIKKWNTSTGGSTSGSLTGGTTRGITSLDGMFKDYTDLNNNSDLTTAITQAQEVAQGGEVLKVNSDTAENALQVYLVFPSVATPQYAGEYKDTLTFTVSVEQTGGNN